MKKMILHAREYSYPPINLPEEILERYDVRIIDYPEEAIGLLERTGDGIDAFVLGVLMAQDKVPLEKINAAFKAKDDAMSELAKAKGKPQEPYLREKYNALFQRAYSLIDPCAGLTVYDCLNERGYVGRKPILFFTTQEAYNKVVDGDGGILVSSDASKKVGVLGMPVLGREITDWITRNVG